MSIYKPGGLNFLQKLPTILLSNNSHEYTIDEFHPGIAQSISLFPIGCEIGNFQNISH
jgi:hypothetical protein